MAAAPVITFDMGGPVLWEWIAKYPNGTPQRFQTRNRLQTEAEMRAFIAKGFRNLEVVEVKRVEIERPPAGIMSYKAFTLGIIDEVRDEVARQKMRGRAVFSRSLLHDPPRQA